MAEPTLQLSNDARSTEIVSTLRNFLKAQSTRVSLYKEFNDAFKDFTADKLTPDEYTTICGIVTEGFVELSIEILALEAHLGGQQQEAASSSETSVSSPQQQQQPKLLQSPEHAQLIRQVQILEKEKLQITVQGQKLVLAKKEQDQQKLLATEQEAREARVLAGDVDEDDESKVQATRIHSPPTTTESTITAAGAEVLNLSEEEWDEKLKGNRTSLNQIIEDINDKLADIQEAIAVLVL